MFLHRWSPLLLSFLLSAAYAYFSCDFEDGSMCTYKVSEETDGFKWRVYSDDSGLNRTYTLGDQKSAKASFIYLSSRTDSSPQDNVQPASIVSKTSRLPSGIYCLEFKYRMAGPRVGKLTIGLFSDSQQRVLFEKSGHQGGVWHWAEIQLTEPSPGRLSTHLAITGHAEAFTEGEIALDDIRLNNRECRNQPGIACSFITDCGYSKFGKKKSDLQWHLRSGFDDSEGPGPQTDFSTGTAYGSWAVAELDENTPALETVSADRKGLKISRNANRCVRFRYSLGVGASLHVGTAFSTGAQAWREWVWTSRDSDPREKWLLGELSVYTNRADVMLAFKARKGKKTKSTYVALDDVVLSLGRCPIRGNNYFEDGFDLYDNTDDNDDFDWIVTSTSGFKGSNVKLGDHTTGTSMGHYALAYFKGENKGNTAQLISPTFRQGEVSCLQFSYSFNSANAGVLNVYLKNKKSSQNLTAISKETNTKTWTTRTLSIDAKGKTFQLVFEATVGNDRKGYIALDDIIVSDSSCLDGNSQIDWSLVPSSHATSNVDCTFENKTLCSWKQAPDSDFDLKVSEIGEDPKGPETYHAGTDRENVLLKPSTPAQTGQGGVISPVLSGNTDGHCLSFWYWLRGRGVSLQVHMAALDQDREDTLIWQRPFDDGASWQWAEIVIYAETNFQVRIQGEALFEDSLFAIDDILYSPKACNNRSINFIDMCDFETGLCGLKKSVLSEESWTLFSGSMSNHAGWPKEDYTYKTDKGHFMLFNQSLMSEESIAIQETSVLSAPSDTLGGQICLRFHYFLSGPDVGSLEVSVHLHDEEIDTVLWKTSGNHGEVWIPAEVQLTVEDDSGLSVEFKAVSGAGPLGVFGVDDIAMRQGKCSSPGSCGFETKTLCTWWVEQDPTFYPWHFYNINKRDHGILYEPKVVTNQTSTLVSEFFSGNQVRCLHFIFAHERGSGTLSVFVNHFRRRDPNQLVWSMNFSRPDSNSTGLNWTAASVSVGQDSANSYQIHISAKEFESDYRLLLDNLMVTNQPCQATPAEAVSFDCDFSEGFCYWHQDIFDDSNWLTSPANPDRPFFAYVEPHSNSEETVCRLFSPLIPAGEQCMRFAYFIYGADVSHLRVLTDQGHVRMTYASYKGLPTKSWIDAVVDLTLDYNYQLIIEGKCREGIDCSIGIRNLTFTPSSCPNNKLANGCTFESHANPLCNWIVSPSASLASFTWRQEGVLHLSDEKAPYMDHTYGGKGHYAYVAPPPDMSKKKTFEVTTQLTSPVFESSEDGQYCMTFAYHMVALLSGSLSIYQVKPGKESNNSLWSADTSDQVWAKAFVTLDQMDSFQIVFEATASKRTSQGLAIDDIFLNKGPCKTWGDTCSFTEGLCLWENVRDGTDSFDWIRHQKEVPQDLGPQKDHTNKNTNGYYMMAGKNFAQKGENARLVSEMQFPSHAPSDKCLEFFYYMSGSGSVKLSVNVLRGFESAGESSDVSHLDEMHGEAETPDLSSLSIWELRTNQTERNQWLKATVQINSRYTSLPFKIDFNVVLDDGGVALDDVSVLPNSCETLPQEAIPLDLDLLKSLMWQIVTATLDNIIIPFLNEESCTSYFSVLDRVSCSFKDRSLCGWKTKKTHQSDPQWEIQEVPEGDDQLLFEPFEEELEEWWVSVTLADVGDGSTPTATLESPTLPSTDGVDCLHFSFRLEALQSKSLLIWMLSENDTRTLLWQATSGRQDVYLNIYSPQTFRISIEAGGHGEHIIQKVSITHGVCPRQDLCEFGVADSWCGYIQDDTDDFDWKIARKNYGVRADVAKHSVDEVARIKSPVYEGGGPECLEFSYLRRAAISGQLYVYSQRVGEKELGTPLWEMPYFHTFDYKLERKVHVGIHEASPFQVVFEEKVGVTNGNSPLLHDIKLMPHPCEKLGWCSFEEGLCTFLSGEQSEWSRIMAYQSSQDWHLPYPPMDHTLSYSSGFFLGLNVREDDGGQISSSILPKTAGACLTFAYALSGAAALEVVLDIDGVGNHSVRLITESTVVSHVTTWNISEINIQANHLFVITFIGRLTSPNATSPSGVALDDIEYLPGSCEDQHVSSPTTAPQSPDFVESLSCDFENSSAPLCNFLQDKTADSRASWVRSYGSWNKSGLGFDHTRGDSHGAFVSMVSAGDDDEVAEASLQTFVTLSVLKAPHCLSFWYYMTGNPANTLTVEVVGRSVIWQRNEQTLLWKQAYVSLDLGLNDSEGKDTLIDNDPEAEDTFIDDELDMLSFQGILINDHGHIALDDIKVYSGHCPKSDTCEFEDDGLCDFTQSQFDITHWQRTKAGDILDTVTKVPFADHTYSSSQGHFMYCCSKLPTPSYTSVSMLSTVYEVNPRGRCLVFWYKVAKANLHIVLRDREGHENNILILKGGTHTVDEWKVAHETIMSLSDFQIIFKAFFYQAPELGIDDVQVMPGPCHEMYNCDFTWGFGTWTQTVQGNTAWRLTSGVPPPGQLPLGPRVDHTTQAPAGQYIILQGASESTLPDVVTLNSQNINVGMIGEGYYLDGLCFSFWYYMTDASAGSLTVTVEGTNHTWGPFSHGEERWMQEMMTVFRKGDDKSMQISVIGTVEPGEENYIAVDDLELLSVPCTQVQHKSEFSCRDTSKTTLTYDKVCNFVSECDNGADEKDCDGCTFDESWCRFLDTSNTNSYSWERVSAKPTSRQGYFLQFRNKFNEEGVLETSNTFEASSSTCKLNFSLYMGKASKGRSSFSLRIYVVTHMEETLIQEISATSETWKKGWTDREVYVGNMNVPFRLRFQAQVDASKIGLDDIKIVDCAFPTAQGECSEDQFTCDNNVCIDGYRICDFSNDCGDFSDEKNCDSYVRNDFEYTLGEWSVETAGDAVWRYKSAPARQILIDHTPGTAKGHFLYAYHKKSEKPSLTGYFVSPVLKATSDPKPKPCQVRFFYFSSDKSNHEIHVYTRMANTGDLKEVSLASESQGAWNHVRANVSESADFQVVIQGKSKAGEDLKPISVGLDDISLSDSCELITVLKPGKHSLEPEPEVDVTTTTARTTMMASSTTTQDSRQADQSEGLGPKDKKKGKKLEGKKTTGEKKAKTTTVSPPIKDSDQSRDVDPIIQDQHTPRKQPVIEPGAEDAVTEGTTLSPPEAEDIDQSGDVDPSSKDQRTSRTKPDTGTGHTTGDKTVSPRSRDSGHRGVVHPKDKGQYMNTSGDKQVNWKLPVGLTFGSVGVCLILFLILIYLKRTNISLRGMRRDVKYMNQVFDDNYVPLELQDERYGSQGETRKPMSLDNPLYQENGMETAST